MNNYKEQLKRSLSVEDQNWWGSFFQSKIDWDVTLQDEYDGIDCIINDSRVQLKLREKVYNDILIEFAHSNGEKGWINKTQKCDYIIFGWRDFEKIYVFKWQDLYNFWVDNQVSLFTKYKKTYLHGAINEEKISYNYAIPFQELKGMYNIKTKT